ncbi:hypothetical protein SUDANB105_02189 [Streptomyces sp. enrichment culture]|uniref:hypothetical protein n=1 Tax=Streptomyces sp. enrichment culture TaxID=1795815 RepID=UPI003F56C6DF
MLVGAIAAFASWGLYGPLSGAPILGDEGNPYRFSYGVTASGVAGALLVGVGGAKWLANHVDKRLYQEAATTAAGKAGGPGDVRRMGNAKPSEAVALAAELPDSSP